MPACVHAVLCFVFFFAPAPCIISLLEIKLIKEGEILQLWAEVKTAAGAMKVPFGCCSSVLKSKTFEIFDR